jgi:tetratricopeptide (TPR) repeat protein
MKKRFHWLLFPLLALGILLAGCMRDDSTPLASELDEPNYKQGQQLKKQGRYQEALTAFLKVIAKRNEDAPESHLEVGLIYSQNIRNHVAAIYHFNKYLELQPNSRQAVLVRQQIDGAKRAFARTLPAQSSEMLDDRPELQAQVARLQRENDALKAELAATRGGTSALPVPEPQPSSSNAPSGPTLSRVPMSEPAQGDSPLTLAPVTPAPSPGAFVVPTGRVTAKSGNVHSTPTRPPAAASTPAPAGRKHTVAVKDSIWSIARKYYGSSASTAKVQGILDANRDVLPSANALKPGMELKIP